MPAASYGLSVATLFPATMLWQACAPALTTMNSRSCGPTNRDGTSMRVERARSRIGSWPGAKVIRRDLRCVGGGRRAGGNDDCKTARACWLVGCPCREKLVSEAESLRGIHLCDKPAGVGGSGHRRGIP